MFINEAWELSERVHYVFPEEHTHTHTHTHTQQSEFWHFKKVILNEHFFLGRNVYDRININVTKECIILKSNKSHSKLGN